MSYYEQLIDGILSRFSNHTIRVYKWQSTAANVYKQGTKTYAAPVAVSGHYVHRGDPDVTDLNGKANVAKEDFVVFSLPELRRKFPLANERGWITTNDVIECFGIKYSIISVEYTGFALSGTKLLKLCLQEYPDANIP